MQLGKALGGLSVSLVSSWESTKDPAAPTDERLEAYARLFCTDRSLQGDSLRLLEIAELTPDELRRRDGLLTELKELRSGRDATDASPASAPTGYWHFPDGNTVTIICAKMPKALLGDPKYTDRASPDFVELSHYADPDALIELFGHIRATNPTSYVRFRTTETVAPDNLTDHIVLLGGVDWNTTTTMILERIQLPVRQVNDWEGEKGPYFEVGEERFHPRLDEQGRLQEDVALFYRGPNPLNHKRTLTIANGMYGRGTYGAVRALTDRKFRDRNTEYLHKRFAGQPAFAVLTKVLVVNNVTVTPDWTVESYRLHEWPAP
ncbi:hypothetical protein [Thermoactinospora rubra]|uniref:hypothetical protein n=1 Tax=Thermoactinospora rubra TaxID=1088767 RepID=UPI001F0A5DD7|nr:hypothetical protein [Thermoactinospora rubra]